LSWKISEEFSKNLKNLIFLKFFGVLGIFRIIKKISGTYRNISRVFEEKFA
jgi:hypothetical protein